MRFLQSNRGADSVEWAGTLAVVFAVITIAVAAVAHSTATQATHTSTFIDSVAVPTSMP